MTEAMEKWIEQLSSDPSFNLSDDYTTKAEQVDYVLRAFVDEVRKRAGQLALANSAGVPHDPNFVDYSEAFDELSRELLEEQSKTKGD